MFKVNTKRPRQIPEVRAGERRERKSQKQSFVFVAVVADDATDGGAAAAPFFFFNAFHFLIAKDVIVTTMRVVSTIRL